MSPPNFTIPQLKECLKRLNLSTTGSKTDLLARLNAAGPEGSWMSLLDEVDVGQELAAAEIVEPQPDASRELELIRRERDLLQREMDLMRRENEILRNSPRSVQSHGPNMNVRAVGDLLSDFDGSKNTFLVWEKSLLLLRNTYELDENAIKVLIAAKLKGRALEWLHSKPEHIEMSVEILLSHMKKMFDHRQNKLALRRKFEERSWRIHENFSEYHHDKMILANQVGVEDEELIDYMIDGIPDDLLRNQARMYRFAESSELLEAFEKISLKPRTNKNVVVDKRIMASPRSSGNTCAVNPLQPVRRCYNCNGEGHLADSCLKPKRERGSCFSCGDQGHGYLKCPKSSKAEAPKPTSVSLIDGPQSSTMEGQRRHPPLQTPSRNYCIFLTEEKEEHYFVEALVDSGSAINLMTYKTFNNFFSMYELVQGKHNFNYGGVNQSPLSVMGYVNIRIKLQLVPCDIFEVRFMVVPDSTMTYSALLGREFMTRPGMTVVLSKVISIHYDREYRDEILNIESIETKEKLDTDIDNFDASLSVEVKQTLTELLKNYVNLEGTAEPVDYKFQITLAENSKPFYFSPRRLSWHEKTEVRKIIHDLLSRGIIRQSNSDFCSRIVLVRKKDSSYRLCIDYRALNKITKIEDQIDRLSNSAYFTSLDLKDGFHHIPIFEDSIKFTSLVTPDGQFEYLKMPFGLANAPAAFQRFVHLIFRPLLEFGKVLLHLDDILIAIKNIDENLEILKEVLELLSRHNLELKFSKCKFLKREIEYLGYNININGITPNGSNVKAIQDFPQPKTVKQVQSFLGLTSYFRKFVPNFARIAQPLYNLVKKGMSFKFGVEE
ncbi:uncharacterized protein K02A2.6-like [Hylaeus volcanicus]|uniref:uncharacterized protein K02A2.6-like n=1 Tax=Hylaeus volcanicus TaxID=313075 RepID=UPI0023B858BE|nr:uncharacterized protein K02A2.6-like [Hylaeus volcanicus]